MNALMLAAIQGNIDVVKACLRSAGSVFIKNAVTWLFRNDSISFGMYRVNPQEGSTAFMLSIIHSRMSVVSALLEAGANVNDANHVRAADCRLFAVTGCPSRVCSSQHGYTALMYASQRGNYGAAEFLLSRGANCDDRNNVRHPAIAFSPFPIKDVMILQLGDTALDLARREGHTSIVELLVRA
jgi:ankyrin repeat protein